MDAVGDADALLQVHLASSIELVVDGHTVQVTGPQAAPLPALAIHVLTGHNPGSQRQSAWSNDRANERLWQLLADDNRVIGVWSARGFAGDWSEASVAVAGLKRNDAARIAEAFGQYSLFELDDHVVCVIRCSDRRVVCRPRRRAA